MPFGLKNARETYQRLVDKISNDQIGRHLEAYISTSEESLLKDIQKAFDRLWSINIKLNLKKCSFDVEEGWFLGHVITKKGIRANPLKVKVVTNLEPPRTLKDVHSLNGKFAALGRFPLKKRRIHGNLTNTYSPNQRVLQWAELNYPKLEKLMLPLVHAARRIQRRIAQWAIELGEHDIEFKRRNSVKRHIQADFLIKTPPVEENKMEIRKLGTAKEEAKLENMWKLYTDGASISDGSGISLMQVSLEGKEYRML
nr:hypothetical protein [Tanacetum cinerariifolium]